MSNSVPGPGREWETTRAGRRRDRIRQPEAVAEAPDPRDVRPAWVRTAGHADDALHRGRTRPS